MKNIRAITFVMAMGVLLISLPLFAHHSGSAFDLEHPVTLKGTVTNFEWSNPHVFIALDVKDDKGNVEPWRVEANSPNRLSRVGWKKEMIKEGDQLAVTGFLAKTGRKIMRLHSVTLANGQEFDGEGFKVSGVTLPQSAGCGLYFYASRPRSDRGVKPAGIPRRRGSWCEIFSWEWFSLQQHWLYRPLQLPGRHNTRERHSPMLLPPRRTSLEFGLYLSTIETFSLRRTHLSSHGPRRC